MESYKQDFLYGLHTNYQYMEWKKDESDLISESGSYEIRFGHDGYGVYLQVFPKGKCLGEIIHENEDTEVRDIYDEIWEYVNEGESRIFWSKALQSLNALENMREIMK